MQFQIRCVNQIKKKYLGFSIYNDIIAIDLNKNRSDLVLNEAL